MHCFHLQPILGSFAPSFQSNRTQESPFCTFYVQSLHHLVIPSVTKVLAQKRVEWIEQTTEVKSAESPISLQRADSPGTGQALTVFRKQATSRNKEVIAAMFSVAFVAQSSDSVEMMRIKRLR